MTKFSHDFPAIVSKFAHKLGRSPPRVTESIATAAGIVFLRSYKLGCIVTARGAQGALVVRKQDGSWTNPLALGMGGLALGADIGVENTSMMIVFQTHASCDAFMSGAASFGLNASLIVGRFGETAEGMVFANEDTEVFCFNQKGLYGGLSLEFTGIRLDHERNYAAYDRMQELGLRRPRIEHFTDPQWAEQPGFAQVLHAALADQAARHARARRRAHGDTRFTVRGPAAPWLETQQQAQQQAEVDGAPRPLAPAPRLWAGVQEDVDAFVGVTGADEATARVYLLSHGDIKAAADAYYEDEQSHVAAPDEQVHVYVQQQQQQLIDPFELPAPTPKLQQQPLQRRQRQPAQGAFVPCVAAGAGVAAEEGEGEGGPQRHTVDLLSAPNETLLALDAMHAASPTWSLIYH